MSERASERERGRRGEITHAGNHYGRSDWSRLDVNTIACDRGVKCSPVIGRIVSWSLCTRLSLPSINAFDEKFPLPKIKSAGERRFVDFTERECKARTHASIGTTLRMTPEVGGIGYRRYLTEIKYASSLLGWSIFTRSIELLIIIQFYLAPQVREGIPGLWRSFLN